MQSSIRILGPGKVIAAEVFGGRAWKPRTSADGVAFEIVQLRPCGLINTRQP